MNPVVACGNKNLNPSRRGLCKPLQRILGEVADDHVRSRAFDASQAFKGGAFQIKPAALSGRVDHGIFAADLISRRGQGILLA